MKILYSEDNGCGWRIKAKVRSDGLVEFVRQEKTEKGYWRNSKMPWHKEFWFNPDESYFLMKVVKEVLQP